MDLPAKFIEKYKKLLGDQSDSFLSTFQLPAQKGYRINPSKNFKSRDPKIPWSPNGYYGKISGNSPEHISGAVYSQEPSAQFIAEVVDAQYDEIILDLAAAPGGKTTQIINQMDNKGFLLSNEIDLSRAKVLSQNVERDGGQNTVVASNDSATVAKNFSNYFDKVLLDAPCSGEGMFRKDPDSIKYWDENYSDKLANLQCEILENIESSVRAGGQLIYSTCTFAPEENEQVISWFLDKYPDWHLEEIPKNNGIESGHPDWSDNNPELAKTARLWPHKLDGDGHFVAKLIKNSAEEGSVEKILSSNVKSDELKLFTDFVKKNLTIDLDKMIFRLYQIKDRLYLLPNKTPEKINNLRILRPGLELGIFKKKRFEPVHAMATGFNAEDFISSYSMNDDELKQYLHGEVITTTKNFTGSWLLMTYDNNGVGLGKVDGNQIKNHFPKGLRIN